MPLEYAGEFWNLLEKMKELEMILGILENPGNFWELSGESRGLLGIS